jgi:hypothetical protein
MRVRGAPPPGRGSDRQQTAQNPRSSSDFQRSRYVNQNREQLEKRRMSAILRGANEGSAPSSHWVRAAIPCLVAVLVIGSAWIIAANPQQPVWDQQALLDVRLSGKVVPSPSMGFTSQLVVALAKPLLPSSPAALDAGIRIIAMALYFGAAALLATRLLERKIAVAALLLLLLTSQYPFLWLSSELLTGAFLMFAIAAWSRGAPPVLTGVVLALFALCKPDAILVALVLLAWWTVRAPNRHEATTLVGAFALTLLALMIPGAVTGGAQYFVSHGGSGGRSFASFGQHYAALAANFQIGAEVPNPWSETAAYVDRHFPGASGMSDVVFDHFPRYLEFVALASVRGLFRGIYVTNYAAIAVPIVAFAIYRTRLTPGDHAKTLLLSFIGLLPFVLFAYPHVRYLARYYPIFLLLLFMALERLAAADDSIRRPALVAAIACLAFSLVENSLRLTAALARLPETSVYWFPD